MSWHACSRRTHDQQVERQNTKVVEIHAQADWYRARVEPEKNWRGVLRERQVTVGPATRVALAYTLVTEEGELPVYSAQVVDQLMPFVGKQVIVRGKWVDLSKEGAGPELWIAAIETVEPTPK